MSTYPQWWQHRGRYSSPAYATWVCGAEQVLVDEVIDRTVRDVGALPGNRRWFDAAEADDAWRFLAEYPVVPGMRRLAVLTGAEQITDWGPLHQFLTALSDGLLHTYLVLLSAEHELPGARPTPQSAVVYAPQVAAIEAAKGGAVVECRPLSMAQQVDWLRRRLPAGQAMAEFLMRRVSGELRAAADVAAKLALFRGEPSQQLLSLLTESAEATYVAALLTGDRRGAVAAADAVPVESFPAVVARLDAYLDLLSVLWRIYQASARRLPARKLARLPADRYMLDLCSTLVPRYPPSVRLRARQALAAVDAAYQRGARIALLHALAGAW